MENVLNTIKDVDHNKLYIVFGCTGSRDRVKRPMMTSIALTNADFTFITSDDLHEEEFSQIVDDMLEGNELTNYKVIEDRKEAVNEAISLLGEKDILLILGKGHEEFIIIKDQKIPYNDRKAVMSIIESKECINN
jgi:UDP-N-acetylmuramoyl-L-alanyl-D-glutamate--2,6-diaminopimelate ligase